MNGVFLVGIGAAMVSAELCLTDAEVGLCPPDDLPGPAHWTGFSTDSTACWDPGYAGHPLSLSASASDPFVSQAPLPADGRLYLWLIGYSMSYGYGGIAATFEARGSAQIDGYEPIAAGNHDWNQESRSLSFSAPGTCHPWMVDVPSQIIGAVRLQPTSVDDNAWGRMKAMWR